MAGKSKNLTQRFKKLDRISELPDHLICQILYHLPAKDAVRTSFLSTTWRTLWRWVPRVKLNYRDFRDLRAFVSFGDNFFHRVSRLENVKLHVGLNEGEDDTSDVTLWIDAAVQRKLQHLHVRGDRNFDTYCMHLYYDIEIYEFHGMPISLYTCETLVSLKLFEMVVLPDSEFISLPCLKTLHLTMIRYPNVATFERLISSCPFLEELEIDGCLNYDNVKFIRVLSSSLKKLIIKDRYNGSKLVIDTPRLVFLCIEARLTESFTITNMDPNVKLVIHLGYRYDEASLLQNRNEFCSFLSGISKVRDITVFGYLLRLHGDTFTGYVCSQWLPTLLESFPNLKSLSLECDPDEDRHHLHLEEMNQINFSYVPECLLSSLEFVDLNVPLSGLSGEMNLVRYILENSAILKKFTLHVHNNCLTNDDFVKKLLKIPRGSTKCEVVFLDWKRVARG